MNLKKILVAFAGVLVVIAGAFLARSYYEAEGMQAGVSLGILEAQYIAKRAVECSLQNQRAYSVIGELQQGIRIIPDDITAGRRFSQDRDYRTLEFVPGLLWPREIVFVCETELPAGVKCIPSDGGTVLVAASNARVGVTTNCSGDRCTVKWGAPKTVDVLPDCTAVPHAVHRFYRQYLKKLNESLYFTHSTGIQLLLDYFSGKIHERVRKVIVGVADLGLTGGAVSEADKEYLAIQANKKYGIPFRDGSKTLEQRLSGLERLVKELRDKAVSASLAASPSPPEFLGTELAKMSAGVSGGTEALYAYNDSETLEDRVMRLSALAVIYRGFTGEEVEQEIANAALWLEKRQNATDANFSLSFRENTTFTLDGAAKKSGLVFSTISLEPPDFGVIQIQGRSAMAAVKAVAGIQVKKECVQKCTYSVTVMAIDLMKRAG